MTMRFKFCITQPVARVIRTGERSNHDLILAAVSHIKLARQHKQIADQKETETTGLTVVLKGDEATVSLFADDSLAQGNPPKGLEGVPISWVQITDIGISHFPAPGPYSGPLGTALVSEDFSTGSEECVPMWTLSLTSPTLEAAIDLYNGIRTGQIKPTVEYKDHRNAASLQGDHA